ncbi:MAG: hypothetical protein QXG00_08770 [Candidatus Woesearchaeota archaeon]
MEIIINFLSNLFNYIDKLPNWMSICVLIFVLLILIFERLIKQGIISLFKKLFVKKRSCGDCILIIFGISEKYRSQEDNITRNLLNKKMVYVEQKIEMMVLELLKKYKDYQSVNLGDNNLKEIEYWGYKHSIINAFDLIKREIKRTFLENGFHILNGKDFSNYVKEKTQELISIFENFMMTDYPKNAIVSFDYLSNDFDKGWFEDIIFDIYIKTKEVQLNAENKIKELEQNLKNDIDNFSRGKNNIIFKSY